MAGFDIDRGRDLTPTERRKLEQELKHLRARGGLTEARVREVAPLLRRLAELEARRREQALGAVGFLIWGLQTLDERGATEPAKIGALRSAYGIDIARLLPNNLSRRREAYGDELVRQAEAQWMRQHGVPGTDQQRADLARHARSAWRNPDTLNTWEDEVIPELAEVLIATALGRDPSIQRIPDALPRRPTRFPSNDLTYVFTSSGAVREVYVVREVEALHDGIDEVEVSHSYYEDSGPDVLSFETHTNCRLTRPVRVMPSRYAHARLDIPRLSHPGDRLRISYYVRIKTSVRSRPVLKTTPRNDQDSYVIRVQFDSACLPLRLWTYHDITDPEIPWSGSDDGEIVTRSSPRRCLPRGSLSALPRRRARSRAVCHADHQPRRLIGDLHRSPLRFAWGSRVYQMSFSEGVWKIWRQAPGFWQRFSGTVSDDGRSIRAAWEKSPDGASWEHDFDRTYTRVE